MTGRAKIGSPARNPHETLPILASAQRYGLRRPDFAVRIGNDFRQRDADGLLEILSD